MSVGNGTSVHIANPNLIQHGLTAAAQNHPLEAFFGPYNGTSRHASRRCASTRNL